MSFRDNLQHLRDTQDMSQADLAQRLGVSRQSVAKWEAEKSYPEMDKLIKICDLFGCSLDDLVRGDLAGSEPAGAERAEGGEALAVVKETSGDVWGYDEHMRRRAWDCAAAVAVIVMGLGAGINFTPMGPNVNPAPFIICLSIGVVLALLLLRPMRAGHREFVKEHPHVDDFYTPEQKAEARSAKGGAIAGAVMLVIVGLSMPGLLGFFHQYAFAVLAMFGCLALAAALAVYAIMMDACVDVSRYNRHSAGEATAESEAPASPTAGDTAAG